MKRLITYKMVNIKNFKLMVNQTSQSQWLNVNLKLMVNQI